MALPSTGSISMSQVNVELKKGETTVITLNDTDVRKLAGKPSGVISMNDLRGKSNTVSVKDYVLFNRRYYDRNKTFNFSITIPKNIAKGNLLIYYQPESGNGENYLKFNNKNMGMGNNYIDISGYKIGTILNGTVSVGHRYNSNGAPTETGATVKISFTGEWEA